MEPPLIVLILVAIIVGCIYGNSSVDDDEIEWRDEAIDSLEELVASLEKDRDYWHTEYKNAVADAGWVEELSGVIDNAIDEFNDSDASIDLLGVDLSSPVKHRTLWLYCEGEEMWYYVGRTESPELATYIGNLVIGELDPLMVGEVGEQEVCFEVRYMTADEIAAIPVD